MDPLCQGEWPLREPVMNLKDRQGANLQEEQEGRHARWLQTRCVAHQYVGWARGMGRRTQQEPLPTSRMVVTQQHETDIRVPQKTDYIMSHTDMLYFSNTS